MQKDVCQNCSYKLINTISNNFKRSTNKINYSNQNYNLTQINKGKHHYLVLFLMMMLMTIIMIIIMIKMIIIMMMMCFLHSLNLIDTPLM